MFNECCTLACSILLLGFSDFISDSVIKYMIGYAFVAIYILNFSFNFIVIIASVLTEAYKKLKGLYYRFKFKKLMA